MFAEMNWPEAAASIVGALCFAFIICTMIIGRWPWER